MAMDKKKLERIVGKIAYKDWKFVIIGIMDRPRESAFIRHGTTVFIEARMPVIDVKGGGKTFVGSRCPVFPRDKQRDLVDRVFDMIVTVESHEAAEVFKVKGRRIYNPHVKRKPIVRLIDFDPNRTRVVASKLSKQTHGKLDRLSRRSRRSMSQTVSLAIDIAMVLNPRVIEDAILAGHW